MAKSAPKFVLVKSTSPRKPDGAFRRAELQFNHDWRVLQVAAEGTAENVDQGLISEARLARLEAETMLAVKPATADQVAEYEKNLADTAGKDPAQVIAELRKHNADLEGRILKLELGSKKDDGKTKS